MPNWPTWTKDEEIVLVFFLSCGIRKRAVRELIAYKCNTTRRDEQDMKHHVFQLHNESRRDSWEGSGRLLVSKEEAPRSRAAVPDVWTIDWKDSWKEKNVDDWLISKTCRNHHLDELTAIGKEEEDMICEVILDNPLILELLMKPSRSKSRMRSTGTGWNIVRETLWTGTFVITTVTMTVTMPMMMAVIMTLPNKAKCASAATKK